MAGFGERVDRLKVAAKGRIDARALTRRHESLVPRVDEWATLSETLRPVYDDYVRNVSDAEWSVSLQTATYLFHLCRATSPARLLDTGSGFSSYVFRLYATEAESVTVVSADDDEEWLDRTRVFLRQRGLSTDGLVAWPPDDLAAGRFDLVFHDLAYSSVRVDTLPLVLRAVRRGGGIVVLDDAHHYGERIFADGRAAGLDLYSLRVRTVDGFGRYAVLGLA